MEKKHKENCLRNFTRCVNIYNDHRELDPLLDQLEILYNKVLKRWDELEEANDAHIAVAEDDDAQGLGKYLDEPEVRYKAVLKCFNSYKQATIRNETVVRAEHETANQQAEARRRTEDVENAREIEIARIKAEKEIQFESMAKEFNLEVDVFVKMNEGVEGVVEDVSDREKRRAWEKLEDQFYLIQKKLVALGSIDLTKNTEEHRATFGEKVEKPFEKSRKWFLTQLKEENPSSSADTRSSSASSTSLTVTKKEAVGLPAFVGDETSSPSPFLVYPVWRKKWDSLVCEYPVKYRENVLWKNLDESARSVFAGHESDYVTAMARLDSFYGNPYKVVTCIMSEVDAPQEIYEGDYQGLISYCNVLEMNYNRLQSMEPPLVHEMSNSSTMSMILCKFPISIAVKWAEFIEDQDVSTKAKPFPTFIAWLVSQKSIWERVAAVELKRGGASALCNYAGGASKPFHSPAAGGMKCFGCGEEGHKKYACPQKSKDKDKKKKLVKKPKVKKFWCAFHKDNTKRCSSLYCQDLRKADASTRIQLLKDNGDCTHCCGDHEAANCTNKHRECGGGKQDRGCSQSHNMHEMFCANARVFAIHQVHLQQNDQPNSVILQIMNVRSPRKGVSCTVFWDLGSSSNFVREAFARLMNFRGVQTRLSVTTLAGAVTDYTVTKYQCCIRDINNELCYFEAYGLECVTGALGTIEVDSIKKLFPELSETDVQMLKRGTKVDFLIGAKHPSWHPQREERSTQGGDLWVYGGIFGKCLGGSHSDIREETDKRSVHYFSVNFGYSIEVKPDAVPHSLEYCPERVVSYVHKAGFCEESLIGQPVCNVVNRSAGSGVVSQAYCHATKTSLIRSEEEFFRSEALGTAVEPQCGSCQCGNCPVPGSKYSFKEQKQYDIIQKNLTYNEDERRWYTVYPWKCPRGTLPKNDQMALQSLLSLEHRLSKDPELAEDFCNQINDMVNRGAAVVLSEEVLEAWQGDYYFLPLVGVKGKKKWLRVCFDAARRQGGYPSMNECLHKGPERFLNNLLAVLLAFRNGRVGYVADISKFHNKVCLGEEDTHMQRFLWRSMDTSVEPQVYAVPVNNFGVVAANCIATSALHKSADHFKDVYPEESEEIKNQTYVDDELGAATDKQQALIRTSRLDEITEHAGMPNKGWVYSGDEKGVVGISGESEDVEDEKVLGSVWDPKLDNFVFNVTLRFKVRRSADVQVSSVAELLSLPPSMITRRSMLSNIHRIFDPTGVLIPVLLQAKLLMRATWIEKGVGWDDPLSPELCTQWLMFLESLLALGDVVVPRSLWPDEEVEGLPVLVVFTDGAALAFGAVAYIRWKLVSGGYWSRLIMAKGKIAPKRIVSIPRMELNGALLGTRVKNFLINETNLKFAKVYHLVDSSTVLGYVHKECGVFHPYEGIRIAEIQSSSTFVEEKLEGWAWVSGDLNPADWGTKPRSVEKVANDPFWQEGPEFLREEEESWPIRYSYKTERLEGEISVGKTSAVFFQSCFPDHLGRLIDNISVWQRLLRSACWLQRLCTSGGSKSSWLCWSEIQRAKVMLVKYVQKELVVELSLAAEQGVGRFRKLAPVCDGEGVWRVGSRLKNFVPFTSDNKMPAIVPPNHRMTLLLMRDAHVFSHAGIDGTLSRFHMKGFWTVRAGHLAKSVKTKCVPCRKVDGATLSQLMGDIPEERLTNLQAWGHCQVDLFGPFSCRGDVNPRSQKKTWAIVIEDTNSGAVYLDVVQNYSADAVIMTMRRFGSLRGWPSKVHSDPGSQLVSASGKLVSWWSDMRDPLQAYAGTESRGKTGFTWDISPADSPWRQGKAERRIGVVKRLIRLSIGDTRLSPLELQTSLMEIANLCNDRPLGGLLPREDGTFEVLTPNHLLTGRSGNPLPDDASLIGNLAMSARYRVVSHVASSFWQRWCTFVGPSLVTRQKWHQVKRNISIGDLVMIADMGKIKGKYKLGVVTSTNSSGDGLVRSATVQYFNRKGVSEKWSPEQVVRSIQRLSLILPVEEQEGKLVVQDTDAKVQVCKESAAKVGV